MAATENTSNFLEWDVTPIGRCSAPHARAVAIGCWRSLPPTSDAAATAAAPAPPASARHPRSSQKENRPRPRPKARAARARNGDRRIDQIAPEAPGAAPVCDPRPRPASRLYPTTSAAKIAASFRVSVMTSPATIQTSTMTRGQNRTDSI